MTLYLDYMATTPVDPRVAAKMWPYLSEISYAGNASALEHDFGVRAMDAVRQACHQVATAIQGDAAGITWTSGATEAINLAIRGALTHYHRKGRHLITWASEHKAVLETYQDLAQQGLAEITILPVQKDGLINIDDLKKACRPDTVLISVCHVNNEIGVIQPIADIADIAHQQGALIHVDAAQTIGKTPLYAHNWALDFITLSAHKAYGPQGIGALYTRQSPKRHLVRQMQGGQQQIWRPGTLPTHQIVGIGEAFSLATSLYPEENKRLHEYAGRILGTLQQHQHIMLNGHAQQRVPHNLNLTFKGYKRQKIFAQLHELAIVSASACQSQHSQPSHVLKALGMSDEDIQASVRLSLGRFTQKEDIETIIHALAPLTSPA